MKVSVSLPAEDVRFLDGYALEQGIASRSAAIHRAVRLLRAAGLGSAYEAAWAEWSSADGDLWDAVVADGVDPDAAR